jgi:lactate dehydrogenase-like 2-hydroxyacid dehydrogenase
MAQQKFRVGITRDNLKPDGKPIFDEACLKTLDDSRIEWEWLPEIEPELTAGTAAKYDALCVMLAKVTRQTVSGPDRRLKLIARFGVGYDTVDVPALTENGVLLTITPDGVRRPVATSALTFVLMLAQKVPTKDRLVREVVGTSGSITSARDFRAARSVPSASATSGPSCSGWPRRSRCVTSLATPTLRRNRSGRSGLPWWTWTRCSENRISCA